MSDPTLWSTEIQLQLDRLWAGSASARDDLMKIAYERLRLLARKMHRRCPAVTPWEDTDDVLQNAAVRLCRAIDDVRPASVRSFINLAAVQIRRELIDLARHYDGPEGPGRHQVSWGRSEGSGSLPRSPDAADDTRDPARLATWTEFHDKIGTLPEIEKEMFDLLWYQGLSQAEAAALLGVTVRVVKYRWRSARLKLHRMLGGRLPV